MRHIGIGPKRTKKKRIGRTEVQKVEQRRIRRKEQGREKEERERELKEKRSERETDIYISIVNNLNMNNSTFIVYLYIHKCLPN